jgi:hypothetical protein
MNWKILSGIVLMLLVAGAIGGVVDHFVFPAKAECPECQECPDCVCGACVCPESTVEECQALSGDELVDVCKDVVCQTRIVYRCEDTGEEIEELIESSPEIRQMYECMEHKTKSDCLADEDCKWYKYPMGSKTCTEDGCTIDYNAGVCFDLGASVGTR